MLKLIQFFKTAFETIFEVINSLGGVIVALINVIRKCVIFLGTIIQHLPAVLTFSLTALVVVCVLYKIPPLEGSKKATI